MNLLHRRLQRLEAARGRPGFACLGDDELDTLMRDGFAAWLRDDPEACPAEMRAELAAFVAAAGQCQGRGAEKQPQHFQGENS